MITFNASQKIFKLDTPNSSYVIGVGDENYLLNLYYGAYIPDDNLWANAKRIKSASFSPANKNIPREEFSTDVAPMEYSCNGSGDFRISALAIKNVHGNTTTDIRYVSHKLYKGKPSLAPLPSVYVNNDDEADTLEILAEDRVTGVKVTLIYTAFNAVDAV